MPSSDPCAPCALIHCFASTSQRSHSLSNTLFGLTSTVKYITTCKETNATYFWSIQNYHYEQRTRTVRDSEGRTRTETYTVRVNTHYASTGGALRCSDHSQVFIPNMRKRNCALDSRLDCAPSAAFHAQYERQKHMFYAANTRDTHQDTSASFELPGMMPYVRCEWADDGEEDPCWANGCCMIVSVLSCTAVCWFLKMRSFMCEDAFTFVKAAHAFA